MMIMATSRDGDSTNPHADRETGRDTRPDAPRDTNRDISDASRFGSVDAATHISPQSASSRLPDAIGKRAVRDRAMGKISVYPY